MKVLVTGGAGFIGSNLVSRLHEQGCHINVIDQLLPQIHGSDATHSPLLAKIKGKCHFFCANVSDRRVVAEALNECDCVIHLAAETGTGQSMYELTRYSEANIHSTAVLLEAVAALAPRIKKFVVASSRAVYGEGKYLVGGGHVFPGPRIETNLKRKLFDPICPSTGQIMTAVATDETSFIQPVSIYGVTKFTQETMSLLTCNSLGIPAVALRFQNVYGPGQPLSNPYTGILSIFSTRILRNNKIEIYEDGNESRDFVYIDDVVDSIVRAIEYDEEENAIFNVGSGVPTSVLAVAEKLCAIYDRYVPIEITGSYRAGDIRHNFACTKRAINSLGFKSEIDFETGLKRFAAWVLTQPLPEDSYDKSVKEMKERGLFK